MGRYLEVAKASLEAEKSVKKPKLNRNEQAFQAAAIEILETPASPAGRTVAALMIGFVVIALVWSWFGQLNVQAELEGKVIPVGQVKVIEPLITGAVKSIRARNGTAVRAGDVLIELDATEHTAERIKAEQEEMVAKIISARLSATLLAIDDHGKLKDIVFAAPEGAPKVVVSLQRDVMAQEISAYRAEQHRIAGDIYLREMEAKRITASIAEREQMLLLTDERQAIFADLEKQGFGSKAKFLDAAQIMQDQVISLASERGQLVEAHAAMAALRLQATERREIFLEQTINKLAENERELAALRQDLAKARMRESLSTLKSPVAGTVQQLTVHTVGEVVQTGQQLMTIVPDGTHLEVEAMLLNKDKGFVNEGQSVRIKVEAFPFTKFGVIDGTVVSISNDSISPSQNGHSPSRPGMPAEGPLVFPVRISMAKQHIAVRGNDVALTPGMSVVAEVKTGHRKVIEFLLDPLMRFKDEALHER